MEKHGYFGIAVILALGLVIGGCGGNGKNVVSSRAYKGHATDQDILNFVKQYPDTVGTRLDVDVFDAVHKAEVASTILLDPKGERLRK